MSSTATSVQISPCFPSANSKTATAIRSTDNELFYVKPEYMKLFPKATIEAATQSDGSIAVPESSNILHIMLHSIHRSTCAHSASTPLESLIVAIDTLPSYGISPATLVTPDTHLFCTLLSHAADRPFDVFALAGHHKMDALAVESSPFALAAISNPGASDAAVERMGALYLARLIRRYKYNEREYRRIIRAPPNLPTTPHEGHCGSADTLRREWNFLVSKKSLDSDCFTEAPQKLQADFMALGNCLSCTECKNVLRQRAEQVAWEWAEVERKI